MKINTCRSALFSGLCLIFSFSIQTTISAQEEPEPNVMILERTSEVGRKLSDVTVSPNPTRDKFGVTINPAKDFEWTVHVINGLGQKVFSQKGKYYQQLDIDVTHFSNGVYFVNYQSNGERKVKKVFIQHGF